MAGALPTAVQAAVCPSGRRLRTRVITRTRFGALSVAAPTKTPTDRARNEPIGAGNPDVMDDRVTSMFDPVHGWPRNMTGRFVVLSGAYVGASLARTCCLARARV
jgi:hypothetical protein